MEGNSENEDIISIRLSLTREDDFPLYDYFLKIKENLGLKTNTEVARICIKKAYENWFVKEKNAK